MSDLNRRELLKQAAAIAAATSMASLEAEAAQQPAGTPGAPPVERFFPGFTRSQVKTSGATINVVKGGQGPPLLIIHGAPQT
jgi:haloacetate dehalogenase